jgi:nitroreductase
VLVESAPLLVVLGADTESRGTRVRVGQAFERLALQATAKGLAIHPMSQVLQLPDRRAELTDVVDVDVDGPVLHLFRLGYADPERGRSSRRPLAEVVD